MDLSNKDVIHQKKNEIEFLQFRRLLEYEDTLTHAYSLGTNSDFRTYKKDEAPIEKYNEQIKSYKKICEVANCDYKNLVKPNQAHTDCVKIVNGKIQKENPDFNLKEYDKTDGLITNKKELILTTTNADCILLLFYDPIKKVIANIHSGWRGTIQRISFKTVQKMKEKYNSDPKDIICCICPSIRKCHFQVEKDVKDIFEEEFKDLEEINQLIEEQIPNEKWLIDTVKINQILLKKAGLRDNNIIDSGICSVCNCDKIHSYRKEKEKYGLNTAIIELK